MRLIIFTNRDLASNYNLNLILPKINSYVTHIFLSDRVGKTNSSTPEQLNALKFFEQKLPNEFLFPLIEKDSKGSSGKKLLTFSELSDAYNIPVESLNDVRSETALKKIRSLEPDLILSVRYGKIFGNDFIRIPRLGVLNLHSGKLPQYRGVLASFRALLNKETQLHTTLHYIDDATIDTGRIVGHSEIDVQKNHSLLQHILDLYPSAQELVVKTIEQIASGKSPETKKQSESDAAYYTFPNPQELEEFQRAGWSMIDTDFYTEFIRQYYQIFRTELRKESFFKQ